MRERGTVVAVEGRRARVRMQPGADCGKCCACAAFGGGDERELEVETDQALAVGAGVVVEVDQGSPWLSVFLLFGLPLLGLVAGVVVGARWGQGDAMPLLLGLGFLVLLFAVAALIDKAVVRKRQKPPAIVEVLGPGPEPGAGAGKWDA